MLHVKWWIDAKNKVRFNYCSPICLKRILSVKKCTITSNGMSANNKIVARDFVLLDYFWY